MNGNLSRYGSRTGLKITLNCKISRYGETKK